MIDRESTFAEPGIVEMLKKDYIPVALDQAYQRRQQDTEGDFYRKIAGQGPRSDFRSTTQGFYVATPTGKLLLFNNNRDPAKLNRLLKQKLTEFKSSGPSSQDEIKSRRIDKRWNVSPPEGGLVVRVRAKVLGGYAEPVRRWDHVFQNAISRDNLWLTKEEQAALARGVITDRVKSRIARYHLVDNTRGEPPMWRRNEIRKLEMSLEGNQLRGTVHLETEKGDRGYQANLLGTVEVKDGKVVRFDVVAKGDFWGEGRYTKRAPKGKFPLAVAFSLADGSDIADKVPPQASRGWVDGYLK